MKAQRGTGTEPARASTWRLFFTAAGAPSEFPLEPERDCILGRSRTADVHVDDVKASRRHARLFFEGGSLRAEDLGSVNGTSVNGRRIESPVTLKDGDTIEIGRSKFRVSAALPVSPEAQTWWFTKQASVEAATASLDHSGRTEQWMAGSLKSVPPGEPVFSRTLIQRAGQSAAGDFAPHVVSSRLGAGPRSCREWRA